MFILDVPNSSSLTLQQHTSSNHETSQINSNDDGDGWHLVGTFKTTTADIKHYYVVPSKINIDNYVSFFNYQKKRSLNYLFF